MATAIDTLPLSLGPITILPALLGSDPPPDPAAARSPTTVPGIRDVTVRAHMRVFVHYRDGGLRVVEELDPQNFTPLEIRAGGAALAWTPLPRYPGGGISGMLDPAHMVGGSPPAPEEVLATLAAAVDRIAPAAQWTDHVWARDKDGWPVSPTNPQAVAWCAAGSLDLEVQRRGGARALLSACAAALNRPALRYCTAIRGHWMVDPALHPYPFVAVNEAFGHAAILHVFEWAIEDVQRQIARAPVERLAPINAAPINAAVIAEVRRLLDQQVPARVPT
jgi:hypothetical protein